MLHLMPQIHNPNAKDTKYANLNNKYANQNSKYANQNSKYAQYINLRCFVAMQFLSQI